NAMWQVLHVFSTAGASILGAGMFIPLTYFVWSMRYGRFAPANPWPSTGLEWRTPSPPPTENFARTPIVTWEAYEFRPVEEMKVIGPGDDTPEESVQPAHGVHGMGDSKGELR
ncbi:MAG: hypothetical protein M3Q76_09460, partial [Acidobacteriota bacterium]|nr:hypothetical protein [Acidobacteriota bacterium]